MSGLTQCSKTTFLFDHPIGARAYDIDRLLTVDDKGPELMAERSVLLALHASHHKGLRG